MGKSNPTIGFWYNVAFQAGLSYGPIDRLLEMRCGPKRAWSGKLEQSGDVIINEPNLFGGETDQGGIVGTLAVHFGDGDAEPDPYMLTAFGAQVPPYRGLANVVWRGGKYGALNPYPQKPSFLISKIKNGWDSGACWYPEKAEIVLETAAVSWADDGWEYQIENFLEPNTVWDDWVIPTTGWLPGGEMPYNTNGMTGGEFWTPTRSNIWVRRTVTPRVAGLTMHVAADNGCVVFINGQQFGGSNLDNDPISGNEQNPVDIPLTRAQTFVVVAKGFAEKNLGDEGGNGINITITGAIPGAINPAHALYYALTQSHLGRHPIAQIDDASFRAGADWFHDQGFGLCIDIDPDNESADKLIQRICEAANCSVTRSAVDGKWYLDLANGVYDINALPILTDDDILDFSDQPAIPDQAVNSVSVQYFDVTLKAQRTTAPVQALGLIDQFGVIHQDKDYKEIPTPDMAAWAAARDARAVIALTHGFQITTTRKPYAWRRNTYFRLQSPRNGIADMVCLLGTIDTGTLRSGAIKITAVQDVFAAPDAVYIDTEHGVDTTPPQDPVAVAAQAAMELPYAILASGLTPSALDALTADAAFLGTVALAPDRYRDYGVAVSIDSGTTYDVTGRGPWCPTAIVATADDLSGAGPVTAVTLTDGDRLADVALGGAALWGTEIVRVDAIDPDAGTATLARGCIDTVPAAHAANGRIWFFDDNLGVDQVQYSDAETIAVKLLTASGSAQLDPANATAMPITFAGRASLPYPPAKFRVNGDFSPGAITGTLTITWAARNRLTQADQLVDNSAGAVTPDTWTRYAIELRDASSTLLASKYDIDPAAGTASASLSYTGDLTVTLYATNEAGDSLQQQTRTFAYAAPASPTDAIAATSWTRPTWTIDGNEA